MSTDYQLRVTIAAPEAALGDASQLALVTGESAADDQTFGAATWQDASGNRYAVASTAATPNFKQKAAQALVAPDYAPDADMAAAGRAQAMLEIEDRTAPDPAPVQAGTGRIAAIADTAGASALEHVASLGLTPIPSEGAV